MVGGGIFAVYSSIVVQLDVICKLKIHKYIVKKKTFINMGNKEEN